MANLFTDTGPVEDAVPLLSDVMKTNQNLAEAHWALGYAYRFAGMLNESIAEGELARELDPGVKANNSAFNSYLYHGNYERFLKSLPESLPEADNGFVIFYRGMAKYYLKNFAGAVADFDRAYELDPSLYTRTGKALSYNIAGQRQQAQQLLRETWQMIDERGVHEAEGVYKIAQAFAVLGDKEWALRMLGQSIEGGFFCYPYFVNDPLLESIRTEPEYGALIEKARQRQEEFRKKFF
jgi:tetratricopeptide (TPR) repeat protein